MPAAHEVNMFARHRDDQVGAVDVVCSELVAPVMAWVDSDDLERCFWSCGSSAGSRLRGCLPSSTATRQTQRADDAPGHHRSGGVPGAEEHQVRNVRIGIRGSRSGKPEVQHSYWPHFLVAHIPMAQFPIGSSLPCRRGSGARPSVQPTSASRRNRDSAACRSHHEGTHGGRHLCRSS